MSIIWHIPESSCLAWALTLSSSHLANACMWWSEQKLQKCLRMDWFIPHTPKKSTVEAGTPPAGGNRELEREAGFGCVMLLWETSWIVMDLQSNYSWKSTLFFDQMCPLAEHLVQSGVRLLSGGEKEIHEEPKTLTKEVTHSSMNVMEYNKVRSWQQGNHNVRVKFLLSLTLCPMSRAQFLSLDCWVVRILPRGWKKPAETTLAAAEALRFCFTLTVEWWVPWEHLSPIACEPPLEVNWPQPFRVGSLAEFNTWTLMWGLKSQEDSALVATTYNFVE